MTKQQKSIRSQKKVTKIAKRQLSFAAFIAISALLCLTCMITISRLHIFDSITSNAQQYYENIDSFSSFDQVQPAASASKDLTFFSILTQFSLQPNYLLPLLLQFAAIFIIALKWPCDKIYVALLSSTLGIMFGFLLLWFEPQNFIVYKLTYVLHALLSVPLQITSSFGLIKLIPRDMLKYKGFYACLMFFLPGLGASFSQLYINWQLGEDISINDAIYSSIVTLSSIGLLITIATFFILYESRKQILYTLEIKERSAIQSINAGIKQQNQIKGKSKKVLQAKKEVEQTVKGNETIENELQVEPQIKPKKKKIVERISMEQLGGIVLIWGAIIAIGRQLPKIQGKLQLKLNMSKSLGFQQSWIQSQTYSAFSGELMFSGLTIAMGIILLTLLRSKKATSIQLAMGCSIIGFACLTVLLLLSRQLVDLTSENVTSILIVGRSSLFSFIIPSLLYVEAAGIPVAHAATILLLISWASQIVIRIVLDALQVDSVLYILTVMVIVCCYGIQQSYKGTRDLQQQWEYRKIDECHFDDSATEEPQQHKQSVHAVQQMVQLKLEQSTDVPA